LAYHRINLREPGKERMISAPVFDYQDLSKGPKRASEDDFSVERRNHLSVWPCLKTYTSRCVPEVCRLTVSTYEFSPHRQG
jgi:hypothetical protein